MAKIIWVPMVDEAIGAMKMHNISMYSMPRYSAGSLVIAKKHVCSVTEGLTYPGVSTFLESQLGLREKFFLGALSVHLHCDSLYLLGAGHKPRLLGCWTGLTHPSHFPSLHLALLSIPFLCLRPMACLTPMATTV